MGLGTIMNSIWSAQKDEICSGGYLIFYEDTGDPRTSKTLAFITPEAIEVFLYCIFKEYIQMDNINDWIRRGRHE